jgi:serine/threonine protein kinase
MAPLKHDNLVRLYGGVWSEGADKLCIVIEFCPHGSLKTYLVKSPGTWQGTRHALALGTAKGLAYLHHELAEPLIHRDIKPDNVLVGEGIVAKLADFGESTHFDTDRAKRDADSAGDDALTMTMVGTKLYCPPEIMMLERCK